MAEHLKTIAIVINWKMELRTHSAYGLQIGGHPYPHLGMI